MKEIEQQDDVLQSIKMSKIILPMLIGVAVVVYLMFNQFDIKEFNKITWGTHAFFWIGISVALLVLRHLAYAYRLRVLSDKVFSWKKAIELVFIWEFSSAVSPTSVGGSAVAFFVLSQEKLTVAKTATIVLFTIILDTLFFIGTLPLLYLIFGTEMIRPGVETDLSGWSITFYLAYAAMAIYGSIFYYGLFINPIKIKKFLIFLTKNRFFRKRRDAAIKLGDDIIIASKELKAKPFSHKLKAFLATATAWSTRFLLLSMLIIALQSDVALDFFSQLKLYSRLESMYVIMAFSPTPGSAGVAEVLFKGFLTDYLKDDTVSSIIAIIWRVMTYYSYLLIGVLIIPNWIRKRVADRAKK